MERGGLDDQRISQQTGNVPAPVSAEKGSDRLPEFRADPGRQKTEDAHPGRGSFAAMIFLKPASVPFFPDPNGPGQTGYGIADFHDGQSSIEISRPVGYSSG